MWLLACFVVSALISLETLRRPDVVGVVRQRNIVILGVMTTSFVAYSFVEQLTQNVHLAAFSGVLLALLCAWVIVARHTNRRSGDDLPGE